MKKLFSLVLALALVLSLAACSSNSGEGGSSNSPEGEDKFKVAVLVPDTINDGSWGTNGYEAAKAVAEAYDGEFSYVEIKSPSEVVTALTDYSERGFDIIFCHGSEYETNCTQVAPNYPNTYYAVSGGTTYTENITSIDFKTMEGAYLAGVVAAKMTETGKVATIGALELPTIMDTMNGFKDGVEATDPNVECILSFTGSNTDVAKARETVLALANNGVDIMDIHCNQASQGAYAAGMEIVDKVKMIAGNGQMSADFPQLMIADTYTSYTNAFLTLAKDVANGEFKQGEGAYSVGVADGAVMFDLNPEMEIPEEARAAYEEAYQGILDGTIVVERHSNTEEG